MEFRFQWGDQEVDVELNPGAQGESARVNGRDLRFRRVSGGAGSILVEVGGHLRKFAFAVEGETILLAHRGEAYRLERIDALSVGRAHAHHDQGLEAPMPGVVRGVTVVQGDEVERGQTLVLLEAMKMEIRITAPQRSRVAKILCSVGDQVERGQVLVDLEGEAESSR
jgi:3-methylcrotonyl-CoA carboxylase alpha subunit